MLGLRCYESARVEDEAEEQEEKDMCNGCVV
jgi:hypothetical protein